MVKTILITGCSSGFGKEMVNSLLNDGHCVLATMRNAKERANIFSSHENLTILELDVTSQENRKSVLKYIEDNNLKLDVLINNAG